MARPQRVALTSRPEAQEAADECLKAGGTAFDAALAAFFATAGATPWGLLSPLTLLVAGGGAGARFVDGRARQPGQGVERPVRYTSESDAPLFACVSAPATLAAVSHACAQFGRETLVKLAVYGSRQARKQGARQRASFIQRVGSAKAWALQDRAFLAEVAERVPRFEGALLQPADLAIEGADIVACEPSHRIADLPAALAPWHSPRSASPAPAAASSPASGPKAPAGPSTRPAATDAPASTDDASTDDASTGATATASWHDTPTAAPGLVVLVAERGAFAGLILQQPPRGVMLYDDELSLPALAPPTLKGVTRLRPGAPLPMAAPLAALFDGLRPAMLAATTADDFDDAEMRSLLRTSDGGWGFVEPALRAGQSLAVRAL